MLSMDFFFGRMSSIPDGKPISLGNWLHQSFTLCCSYAGVVTFNNIITKSIIIITN